MGIAQRLQDIRHGFERPFWVANISELFERLSYYAAFASLARYLNESLGFPAQDASSLTGAVRLYEQAGMRAIQQVTTFEKELRAGVDLATQTIYS